MVDIKTDPEFFMADFMLSEQELIEAPIAIYTGMIWDLFKIASPEQFPDFFVKMVKGFTGNTTSAVGWAILAMDRPATDSAITLYISLNARACLCNIFRSPISIRLLHLPAPIYLLEGVPVNWTQKTVN